MVKRKKYLHEPKPGYLYVRKGGMYLGRITAPRNSEEFDRQYWEIINGKKFAKTTFSELIESYRNSERWRPLAVRTRRTYESAMRYIEEKNGSKNAVLVRRKDLIKARDANKHRPRFANHILAVMSVLYEHAIDLGWIDSNPVKGVQKLKIPSNRQRPHIPWTDEACALFRKEAHHEAVLVFEMGIGSVQRPSDLVEFSWGDYDGFALDVTQGKTNKQLWLPCSNRLKSILDSELYLLGGRPHPSSKILRGSRGGSLSYSGMAQMLGKERKRLDLLTYDLHALRYRGVMELAWAGCSDDEIMAYSGHDTKDMVAKYAGKARQTMRAKAAWEKRNDADEGKT